MSSKEKEVTLEELLEKNKERRDLLEAKMKAHEDEEKRKRSELLLKRKQSRRQRGLNRSFTSTYSSNVDFDEDANTLNIHTDHKIEPPEEVNEVSRSKRSKGRRKLSRKGSTISYSGKGATFNDITLSSDIGKAREKSGNEADSLDSSNTLEASDSLRSLDTSRKSSFTSSDSDVPVHTENNQFQKSSLEEHIMRPGKVANIPLENIAPNESVNTKISSPRTNSPRLNSPRVLDSLDLSASLNASPQRKRRTFKRNNTSSDIDILELEPEIEPEIQHEILAPTPIEEIEEPKQEKTRSRRGGKSRRGKGRKLQRSVSERIEISSELEEEKQQELDEEELEMIERRKKLQEKLAARRKEREQSLHKKNQAQKLEKAQKRLEIEEQRKEMAKMLPKIKDRSQFQFPPDIDWTKRQVESVPLPANGTLEFYDFFDQDLNLNYEKLKNHLMGQGKVSKDAVAMLIEKATDILSKEPSVVEMSGTVNIVGDIHGQFYDLLHMFLEAGSPMKNQYLFLGDYVDRGMFSIEVCILLYALKIATPYTFTLLRGNHEARMITRTYGFYDEVLYKYDYNIYSMFMTSFDALPLACIVESEKLGRFFCCHGGLSDNIQSIEDVTNINRFQEPMNGVLIDILWADPSDDHPERRYVVNTQRGCSYIYGYDPIREFLEFNDFTSIIRAHQVKNDGYEAMKFDEFDHNREHPLLFTVFSAPNYCDFYNNRAAYMTISDQEYTLSQFEYQDHPYVDPGYRHAFAMTLPILAKQMMKFLNAIKGNDPHLN